MACWAADQSPRTAAKRPYFAKSWQPGWARRIRTIFIAAVTAAARLPSPFKSLGAVRIPDFATRPASRIVFKSIEWAEGAAVLASIFPASRTVFILRHPCGQVASVMHGNSQRRFDLKSGGTDMPFNEACAIRYAALHGINEPEFQRLPDAAKYAWSWRAFNEPTYAALAARSNVHVVLYEALCAQPEALSRRILAFIDLQWDKQTEHFVARGPGHRGEAGYYAIVRNTAAAAEAWRSTMPLPDQDAVRSVVAASPLARFWPDLMRAR